MTWKWLTYWHSSKRSFRTFRLTSTPFNHKAQLLVECLERRDVPSAVLWTNKLDYAPGSTAILNGSGFQLGETIELQVLHTDGTPDSGPGHAGHDPWFVTDGGAGDLDGKVDGKIQTTWYVNPDDSAGSSFQATALGLSSGNSAQVRFTDAATPEPDPTFSPTPPTTVINSSIRITITGKDEDNDFQEDPGFQFVVTSGPSHGSLNVGSTFTGAITNDQTSNAEMTATVTYTPTNGFVGSDSFTIKSSSNPEANDSNLVTINITVDPAISASAGGNQQTFISQPFATNLQVKVLDSRHAPLAGASVTFTAPATGASATFAAGPGVSVDGKSCTVTTGANGLATAPVLTANSTVGTYQVIATAKDLNGNDIPGNASFNLTNESLLVTPVAPAPTSTVVDTTFSPNLKVVVKDQGGNGVQGISITFSAPLFGPSGVFASGPGVLSQGGRSYTVLTDSQGVATASALRANNVVGNYSATAGVTGVGGGATFALANTAGRLVFLTPPPASFFGGVSITIKIQLVDDATGRPLAYAGRIVHLRLANGTLLGTAKTDAKGVATFMTTFKLPGIYRLKAELMSLAQPNIVEDSIFSSPFRVKNRYRFGL
jgi:hypothetical protein